MYLLIVWKMQMQRQHVFDNIEKMVIKRTNQSGGYGMVMGNTASPEELTRNKSAILETPREFIAQPIIKLVNRSLFY